MQRIDDKGVQTFAQQEAKNVVAVVSCGLKSYFYFFVGTGAVLNGFKQCVKAVSVVGDCEHVGQDLALRADDKAVVFALCDIDSYTDHNDTSAI